MKKANRILLLGVGILVLLAGVLFFCLKGNHSGGKKLSKLHLQSSETETETWSPEERVGMLNALYGKLMEKMIVESSQERAKRTGNKDAAPLYQEYYGGGYLENDKLILCVTDESKISDFDEDLIRDGLVEFKKVTYSLNELLAFKDELIDKWDQYDKQYQGTDSIEFETVSSIQGVSVMEQTNRIMVDFAGVTPEKEEVFQRLFGDKDYLEINDVPKDTENYAVY